ncbi:YjjG family noncanonical pyrimidine nucleotidase [Nemorincola caseinilytica]|uniref:YjjG family noncanonical pyrimidine nucleotidase n=1 Tax=Nemorincola caseinilytica TaxID=2054315 RepID=A0ABP8NF61_9BACT
MSRTYKHLFFDLDHTLWDFDKNSEATLRRLYTEYDLAGHGINDFDKLFASYNIHNDKLWTRYRNGYIKRDELRWKRMWLMLLDFKVADTYLAHELSTAYLEILPTQTRLIPDAKELLDHCKGRYEMHLITNGFETTQRLKLQYSGISRYFTHIITSERSNSMKPYRDIFDYALKEAGASTDDSIMIGDAVDIDIAGAINAGWDCAYYNPVKAEHAHKPTYEVAGLAELMRIF